MHNQRLGLRSCFLFLAKQPYSLGNFPPSPPRQVCAVIMCLLKLGTHESDRPLLTTSHNWGKTERSRDVATTASSPFCRAFFFYVPLLRAVEYKGTVDGVCLITGAQPTHTHTHLEHSFTWPANSNNMCPSLIIFYHLYYYAPPAQHSLIHPMNPPTCRLPYAPNTHAHARAHTTRNISLCSSRLQSTAFLMTFFF